MPGIFPLNPKTFLVLPLEDCISNPMQSLGFECRPPKANLIFRNIQRNE